MIQISLNKEELGNNIKQLRLKNALSIANLAKKLRANSKDLEDVAKKEALLTDNIKEAIHPIEVQGNAI